MPSPSKAELKRRSINSKKLYCGDQTKLPKGYWNFGTRSQCMRRGVGVGLYVIPTQKSKERKDIYKQRRKMFSKKKKSLDDLIHEESIDNSDEENRVNNLRNKNSYKEFIEDKFNIALKKSHNLELGDIFKQLSILWKLEQKILKKEYNDRRRKRSRDIRSKN